MPSDTAPDNERTERSTVAAALEVASAAEKAALGLVEGSPSMYLAAAEAAWLPGAHRWLQAVGLPDPVLSEPPVALWRLEAGSRSAFVRLSKYATAQSIKLRSYLHEDGRWLALKVWGGAPELTDRALRERQTREAVAGIEEYAAPSLLAAGSGTDFFYLVEHAISGKHPETRAERLNAAVELGRSLLAAYRASGVQLRRLSEVVRPEFADGIRAVLDERSLPWPNSWRRSRVTRWIRRLVSSDRLLPCALGHGDLNFDNVVLDVRGRHWLVDWEQGGIRPVAFDLRRLLRDSKDPGEVQRSLEVDLRPFDRLGRQVYRWNEQLALAMCNELVLTPVRRERARAHGQLTHFDALLADSLDWLVDLLD